MDVKLEFINDNSVQTQDVDYRDVGQERVREIRLSARHDDDDDI